MSRLVDRLTALPMQRVFLALFIPLALGMLLAMPILRAPDEPAHLQQSFLNAEGQTLDALLTGSFTQPEGLLEPADAAHVTRRDALAMLQESVSDGRVTCSRNTATALYPPPGYLPQTAAMALTALFTDSRGVILYSARLGNLACVTALLYWAIRLLPRGKGLAVAFTLTPLSLQQAASASLDGMAMALVFALCAFALNRREAGRLSRGDMARMALMLLGLCCWKVAYLPAALLLWLIPGQAFGGGKRRSVTLGVMAASAALLLAAWALLCWTVMFRGADEGLNGRMAGNVARFLRAPWDFVPCMLRALAQHGGSYAAQLLGYGQSFSWFNADIGPGLWLAQAAVLAALWRCEAGHALNAGQRWLTAGACAACVTLSFLMLYLWWTPEGSPAVEGFQGRYLLPLLLPAAAALQPAWKRVAPRLALPILTAQAALSGVAILRLAACMA